MKNLRSYTDPTSNKFLLGLSVVLLLLFGSVLVTLSMVLISEYPVFGVLISGMLLLGHFLSKKEIRKR